MILSTVTYAQKASLTGCVIDSVSQIPLERVSIILMNRTDTTDKNATFTNEFGCFQFKNVLRTNYILKISRIGYQDLEKNIAIRKDFEDIGTIKLVQQPIQMKSMDIIAHLPPVEQHHDTVQFNAGAFRTNPDATVEDLVKKLPGVTVENKTVKAQGEEIKQVLVDGRQFFGTDPMIALSNLPADMVDKIQVYNKLSDQAELTKFDDGQSIKTMNIITKENRRHAKFGKIFGGWGNEKYLAGGMLNIFNGDERYSIIASSNNINQQSFTIQDMLGAISGDRGGGKGSGDELGNPSSKRSNSIGQQSGINTIHTFGINYSNQLTENLYATSHYFGNVIKNDNETALDRQYRIGLNDNQFYHEKSISNNNNYNHRFQMRLEYKIDSLNAIIVDPRISMQTSDVSALSFANMNNPDGSQIYNAQIKSSTNSKGYNLETSILYSHIFDLQGRTFVANVRLNTNQKKSDGLTQSITTYYKDAITKTDSLNQKIISVIPGYTITSGIAYTEPFGERNLFQLSYNISAMNTEFDKKVYGYNSVNKEYGILRDSLSNVFNSEYVAHQVGFGYRGKTKKMNIIADVSFQQASLEGKYKYPAIYSLSKHYSNILPMALIMYRPSSYNSFHLMYRTSTETPSINQLQSVVDSTKSTILTIGNPNLSQSYSHELMMNYSFSNILNGSSFFVMLNARTIRHYIASSTYLFSHDTTLSNDISLSRGTQMIKPINIDGYYNINTMCFYGISIDWIRCNFNLNVGLSYTRTPAATNDVVNYSQAYGLNQGIVLASNINEDIDFTLIYSHTLTYSKNSKESNLNSRYYQQNANFRMNVNIWNGIIVRTDLTHQLYNTEGTLQDRHYLLWNLGVAKKFLKNQSLEIALSAYDILHQNQSISHEVTSTYIEDKQSKMLTNYVMLTITYTIRSNASL